MAKVVESISRLKYRKIINVLDFYLLGVRAQTVIVIPIEVKSKLTTYWSCYGVYRIYRKSVKD
jgi:hypothetical protein